ncbi:XdhC family protein [Streptomyces sp. M10(2022)]
MRELLSQLRDWHESGTPFALATVVAVRGSALAPRRRDGRDRRRIGGGQRLRGVWRATCTRWRSRRSPPAAPAADVRHQR